MRPGGVPTTLGDRGRLVHSRRLRRSRAGRDSPHRPRRRADARVHARRDEGHGQGNPPGDAARLGAAIVLGNAYHLHFRPGAALVEELGGLHRFMGWDGPILTDSGGFQVFSLRDTLLSVDDEGVTFRSVYDGDATRFTPELVADVQRRLGSDIAMCLDVCPPAGADRARLEQAVEPHDGSGRSVSLPRPGPSISSSSGSPRAGSTPSFAAARSRRFARSASTATRSAASAWARSARAMLETVAGAAPLLPADRPRYFMGIGDPVGILEVVERGIDMFDCVLPTRLGRTGTALSWEGRLNLRNARFARDDRPLDDDCPLPCVRRVLARLPAPPGQPAGAPGLDTFVRAQRPFSPRLDRRRTEEHRAGRVRRLQGRRPRPARTSPRAPAREVHVAFIVILLVMLGFMYFLLIRPQRSQQRRHRDLLESLEAGRRGDHRRRHLR